MRGIGSSQPDPYSSVAGAAARSMVPLHGGANEAVLRHVNGDRFQGKSCRFH
jgi:citrate synthase